MKIKSVLFGLSIVYLFSSCIGLADVTADSKKQTHHYQTPVTDAQAKQNIKKFSQRYIKNNPSSQLGFFNQQPDKQKALSRWLSNIKPRQDILNKISKPAEKSMPWYRYQKIWLKDKRINQGVDFWKKHQATLAKAEKEFGVNAEIIVAIIGVETFYGRIQGSDPVVEALTTLAFYYPPRAKFFKSELAEYLNLAEQQGWPLQAIKGSYAGAMGMGQFISSSYRQYAIDYNQDGKIDLFNDPVDMIGSIANYFKRHHWRTNGFIIQPVKPKKSQLHLVQSKLKQKHSLKDMQKTGVNTDVLDGKTKTAAIYAFDKDPKQKEYWLAGENFYVISRYNHSAMYALAVYQLSQVIHQKYQHQNS
jgi:membrane-bound lytic murein transglycosylase B